MQKENYKIITSQTLPRKKTIVVISPHPDDIALNCGGTVKFFSRDNKIFGFVMTPGYRAFVPKKSKEEIIELREKETKREAKILNYTPYFLKLKFYDEFKGRFLKSDIDKLKEFLKKINPDIIFLPERKDSHPTHILSRKITLRCLKQLRKKVELWNYETMWDLFDSGEFNTIVVLPDKIFAQKIKAVQQHKSQIQRVPYHKALRALAKFRKILLPEQEFFGYGKSLDIKQSIIKDKNIELFFVEKF